MRYLPDKFLPLFRGRRRCELCEGPANVCDACEPHHVIAKGMGGADTLNLPINLVALGCCWCCQHHNRYHAGRIDRWSVFEAVGRREGLEPGFVESQLWRLVRAPKECHVCERCWGCGTVRVEKGWGFRRGPCVCEGVGILTPSGEIYRERRKFTWQV